MSRNGSSQQQKKFPQGKGDRIQNANTSSHNSSKSDRSSAVADQMLGLCISITGGDRAIVDVEQLNFLLECNEEPARSKVS